MREVPDLFLGIDGGGSGCRAMLCDRDGNRLGSGASGSANILSDPDRAVQNILNAAREALAQADIATDHLKHVPAFLGLAGANMDGAVKKLRCRLPFERCVVENDAVTSLEGAIGPCDGVAAIIGTGSVYARRRAGVFTTVGGWGFLVSDLASGAWLGRCLLREALLVHDGIRESSPLSRAVLDAFSDNPQSIVEYAGTATPGEFGKYAPLIFEHAGRDDPIARRILATAVAHIEETLNAIADDHETGFCMIGGLGPLYTPLLGRHYLERVRNPIADAATGAARLAVKHFACEDA